MVLRLLLCFERFPNTLTSPCAFLLQNPTKIRSKTRNSQPTQFIRTPSQSENRKSESPFSGHSRSRSPASAPRPSPVHRLRRPAKSTPRITTKGVEHTITKKVVVVVEGEEAETSAHVDLDRSSSSSAGGGRAWALLGGASSPPSMASRATLIKPLMRPSFFSFLSLSLLPTLFSLLGSG